MPFGNFLLLLSQIVAILSRKSSGASQVGVAALLVLLNLHHVEVQHLVQVDPVHPAPHPADLLAELVHSGLPHGLVLGCRRRGGPSRFFCRRSWPRCSSRSLNSPVLRHLLLVRVVLLQLLLQNVNHLLQLVCLLFLLGVKFSFVEGPTAIPGQNT